MFKNVNKLSILVHTEMIPTEKGHVKMQSYMYNEPHMIVSNASVIISHTFIFVQVSNQQIHCLVQVDSAMKLYQLH